MDLGQWRRLAAWIASVWPHPGYADPQVESTYFLVRDLEVDDVEAALREVALTEGIAQTPHPSEVRQLTNRWLRTRRKPPTGTGARQEDVSPADDEFVHGLVRDLRRGLVPLRPSGDPLRVGDGTAVAAGRARVRQLRHLTPAGPPPDDAV